MPNTAADLVNNALRQIGALAIEETATNAELADGLDCLNDLLAGWGTEGTMVFTTQPYVFPFVPGQASYTLGAGGNWNIPRPNKIQDAFVRDSHGNDYRVEIVTEQQYSAIITKYTQTSIPQYVYDDQNYPLKTLTWWSVPSDASFSAVLWCWSLLSGTLLASTNATFPPEYARAIKANLAVELCPRYGIPVLPRLQRTADDSKAQIERINYNPRLMSFQPSLVGRGKPFNWYTGQ